MGITFKKQPKETGLSLCGNPYQCVDIKYNKRKFGYIDAPNWQKNNWAIGIAVDKQDIMEDGNKNCPWMWKFTKRIFETEEVARQYIKDNEAEILAMNLHYFDD